MGNFSFLNCLCFTTYKSFVASTVGTVLVRHFSWLQRLYLFTLLLLLAIYDRSVHFTENFTPDKLALPECSTNGYWIVLPFLPINALISCYSSNDRNKDLFIICKKCRVKKICFSPPPYLPGFIDLFHSTTRYIWNSFVVSHKAMTLLLWTKHKNSNKQF